MCGFYYHGRSWFYEEYRDEKTLHHKFLRVGHDFRPMEINSHADLIAPEPLEVHTRGPALTVMGEEASIPRDLGTVRQFPTVVDWGIQPWDGQVVRQDQRQLPTTMPRALLSSDQQFFRDIQQEIERENPITSSDTFVQWATKHWGQHSDEIEFYVESVRCLDTVLLAGKYSEIRTRTRSIERSIGQLEDMRPWTSEIGPWTSGEERRQRIINQACCELIAQTGDRHAQAERFVQMFREAPSEYWRGR